MTCRQHLLRRCLNFDAHLLQGLPHGDCVSLDGWLLVMAAKELPFGVAWSGTVTICPQALRWRKC
jgi:hypothetical protein